MKFLRSTFFLLAAFFLGTLSCDEEEAPDPPEGEGNQMMVTTAEVEYEKGPTATSGGEVTNGEGTAARGVCWSTSPNPTIEDNRSRDGSGIGTFISVLSDLKVSTKYYVRAYATNAVVTVYGNELSFTTTDGLPVVSTHSISDINGSTAVSGGTVTADGGFPVTARGVVWSTSPGPTTADNSTSNGAGVGEFTSSLTGLQVSTTYYVRAYATNAVGTSYGEELSFTTTDGLPTVTTSAITGITVISASGGGEVISDGGFPITARGVVWSTSQNPTTADHSTTDGTGTGTFTSSLTGLIEGTTYYVRAYATNEQGTSYGSEESFEMPPPIAIEFITVNGGTFDMGCTSEQSSCGSNESPVHTVTVSSFSMSKYEITFDQYDAFCEATGRSKPGDNGWGRGSRPVINVDWNDATAFAEYVGGRLPTEAEWEYAARGGAQATSTLYAGSNALSDVGWYSSNSGSETHPVGEKAPNELGLYDMSGNVWEWCGDWYGSYGSSDQTDPTGPDSGSSRVIRGGFWIDDAQACRVASRSGDSPSYSSDGYGFRVVLP